MGGTSDNLHCTACINNTYFEILAALQTMTVETVIRAQIYRLEPDKFPLSSVGWDLARVLS